MATVDKTWVFASDNEGLADVGDSAVSVLHDTGGGNPAGSLEFTGASSGTTERARRATTGQSWETWGVPAGSTVTSVQVISYDKRRWNGGGSVTPRVRMRIVDSSAASVHAAGELIDSTFGTSADGAWSSQGAGTSRAVDAGKQASTTDVRLEVQMDLSGVESGFDFGIDNILLRITYTAGGGSQVSNAWSVAYDIKNQVSRAWSVAYDIKNQTSQTWQLSYDLKNQISRAWQLAYDIVNQVAGEWVVAYDVLNQTSNEWEITYDMGAVVSREWAVAYGLLNNVSRAWVLSYDADADVTVLVAAMEGGRLRQTSDGLLVLSLDPVASVESGFARSASGALVVVTSGPGTWESGFLRDSERRLIVVEDDTGKHSGGFLRASDGSLVVTQSGPFTPESGYMRDALRRLGVVFE